MRQPTIDSAPALRSLIAALPDDRLREFVLEMLLASLTAKAPTGRRLERLTGGHERPAEQHLHRGGLPRGRPRGRPHKPAPGAAARLAQRARDAEKKREKRAEARQARLQEEPGSRSGNATSPASASSAQQMWQHAEKMEPKRPWRAIARELGVNDAVALNAYRAHTLPPGLNSKAVTHFLELPAS